MVLMITLLNIMIIIMLMEILLKIMVMNMLMWILIFDDDFDDNFDIKDGWIIPSVLPLTYASFSQQATLSEPVNVFLKFLILYVELQDQWNNSYFFFLKSIAQPPMNETAPIFFLGEFSHHSFML